VIFGRDTCPTIDHESTIDDRPATGFDDRHKEWKLFRDIVPGDYCLGYWMKDGIQTADKTVLRGIVVAVIDGYIWILSATHRKTRPYKLPSEFEVLVMSDNDV
jgi:hypothetical protein